MLARDRLRSTLKFHRKRGAAWVRLLDKARLLGTAQKRSILWTSLLHRSEIHQTTPYTSEDRYPDLFDLTASLARDAGRVLSYGCSTGEELAALRLRFPRAEIVGVEINPRSRRIARDRFSADPAIQVLRDIPNRAEFDLIFALSVLQREPHKIKEMKVVDLSSHYPFKRFDDCVVRLTASLRRDGLLCVMNAHYRVEDSSAGPGLDVVTSSPLLEQPLFGPDGRLLESGCAHSLFRKR